MNTLNFTLFKNLLICGFFLTSLPLFSNLNPCSDYIFGNANSAITLGVNVSPVIGSEDDLVHISYTILNVSELPIENVSISAKESHYTSKSDMSKSAVNFNGDPNNNGILDPNEIWFYSKVASYNFNQGDVIIISAGVKGNSECGLEVGGGADLLFTYGVNMDVEIEQECVEPGQIIDVTLSTRLLIDEDAAKSPGTTIITVGGIDIEIALPASQWEARDLMISTTDLNGGIEFDPFDPPAGVELTNFCDQGGIDGGRNDQNVLDECESIETVRAPCTEPGEDDILCEYPDWVFCYSVVIPEDYDQDSYTITATDNFNVWKADENPAGSGNYGDFIDVSDQIETGGADAASVEIKTTVIPVELINFNAQKKDNTAALSWTTATEINNSHFMIERSNDGDSFVEIGVAPGAVNSLVRKNYNFVDYSPLRGRNYYRLAQYDLDGTITRTSVETVDFSYLAGSGNISVYPNPISDNLYIKSAIVVENINVVIFNSAGKKVLDKSIGIDENINVSVLRAGQYTIKVYDASRYEIGTKQITVVK